MAVSKDKLIHYAYLLTASSTKKEFQKIHKQIALVLYRELEKAGLIEKWELTDEGEMFLEAFQQTPFPKPTEKDIESLSNFGRNFFAKLANEHYDEIIRGDVKGMAFEPPSEDEPRSKSRRRTKTVRVKRRPR